MRDDPTELKRLLRDLPVTPVPKPEELWQGIQNELAAPPMSGDADARHGSPLRRRVKSPWLVAAAAVAALMLGATGGAYLQFAAPARWNVATLGGAPMVDGAALSGSGSLANGEWLTTDNASSARLTVGRIGIAEVGPESRVRLVRRGLTDHRLVLERGSIHAVISAPPRLFFIETPSALATDLGCAYTIDVDSLGASRLHVTVGWVELDQGGRRSLVPAGMVAVVERNRAPGTPYAAGLNDSAREALGRLDAGSGTDNDLTTVLAAMAAPSAAVVTRQQSGITLWHLIQRVGGSQRDRVLDRLVALSPPPAEVTMEGIRGLDRQMLDRWRRELNPMWGEEAVSVLATVGRRLWMWAMD